MVWIQSAVTAPRTLPLGRGMNGPCALLGTSALHGAHHLLCFRCELIEQNYRSRKVDGHRFAFHIRQDADSTLVGFLEVHA